MLPALLWVLLVAAPAASGPAATPWNLAVLVVDSPLMRQPWLGTTRLAALEKVLEMELSTLPLRMRAGLWLAGRDGVRAMVKPAPALKLKNLELLLPRSGGAGDFMAGLRIALAWLRSQGGGSLLAVSAGKPLPPSKEKLAALGLERDDLFCHAAGLGAGDGVARLEQLVLLGGGAFFPVERLERLGPIFHRAVVTASSPSRLLVLAHDSRNRPQKLIYELRRRGQSAVRRRGLSGRVVQLTSGLYRLEFPPAADLGPGPTPQRVNVGLSGLSRLWAGGFGRLSVEGAGAEGEPLNWSLRVSRLGDGRVVIPQKKVPFRAELPAGLYAVKSLKHPLAWIVELGADREARLTVGPLGSVNLKLRGPRGDLRIPYRVYSLLAGRRYGTGYTNAPLRLPSGRYRLEVELPPGIAREVEVAPGRRTSLQLPLAGELAAPKKAGRAARFQVLDSRGRPTASGAAGRILPLAPGRYRLQWEDRPASPEVLVRAGQTVTVEAP